jgi:hypothetical protein
VTGEFARVTGERGVQRQPGPELGLGSVSPIAFLHDAPQVSAHGDPDPTALILTCANCGAAMDERKCKLICRCGYFLSCSDYY